MTIANSDQSNCISSNLSIFPIWSKDSSMASCCSSLPLKNRVAIVIGASRGIGRAIAIHLHSLGAKVAINYVSSSSQADRLASELNGSDVSEPPRAIAIQADVSDPGQVKMLFDKTQQAFGYPIHILVNSAGVLDSKYPTIANTTLEDWDKTFNINTRGAFVCTREGANRIVKGGGGRIILITSSLIGNNLPGYGAYIASKAAVETMTRIVAKELKGSGITVNCVAPGPIATETFFEIAGKIEEIRKIMVDVCPLERLGEPNDVAQVVGFLASDVGEWINGQIVRANGGLVI